MTGTESFYVATVNRALMTQAPFFQCDGDTLEAHFNVAGTGKAGGKVVAVLGSQLKERSGGWQGFTRSGACFRQRPSMLDGESWSWVSETGKCEAETNQKCEMLSETESAFWFDSVTG